MDEGKTKWITIDINIQLYKHNKYRINEINKKQKKKQKQMKAVLQYFAAIYLLLPLVKSKQNNFIQNERAFS